MMEYAAAESEYVLFMSASVLAGVAITEPEGKIKSRAKAVVRQLHLQK